MFDSPQKTARSPTKTLLTPTKSRARDLLEAVSPQRKILFEPKDTTPSYVKCSPTKQPAYQRHLAIAESKTSSLILPYSYRFLAEVFRCVETVIFQFYKVFTLQCFLTKILSIFSYTVCTFFMMRYQAVCFYFQVSAILFNRNEVITFNKLKPAVQELLRRDFTQDHLAQIKTIYPDAYTYKQEKRRNFGSVSKTEKYELVLTPTVQANNNGDTLDADNILKSVSNKAMGPTILLERKRKFYNILLGII